MVEKRTKCHICGHNMKKLVAPRMFKDRYIVENITFHKCSCCGEELFELKEYEKIRKKISYIEKKESLPMIHNIMSKVRYLVL